MAVKQQILIVTSTPGFGELIQQSLEETGEYEAILVNSAKEALASAQRNPFSLAIIDSDLGDSDFPILTHAMRKIQAHLRLVVIPPDNDPLHPLLAEIPYDGYLSKPFYLPDLLDTVSEVLCAKDVANTTSSLDDVIQPSTSGIDIKASSLAWLNDVSRAAQHLTRLSLESSAQAALIVRQGELWAYAGQLDQSAAQELTDAVVHFWTDNQKPTSRHISPMTDMVRVVRLFATGIDYLLYVTALGREMVLALAFDAATPFSTIRAQSSSLARSLISPSEGQSQVKPLTNATQRVSRLLRGANSPPLAALNDDIVDQNKADLENDLHFVDLPPLIEDVPLPNPKKPPVRHTVREDDTPFVAKPAKVTSKNLGGQNQNFSREASPAIHLDQSVRAVDQLSISPKLSESNQTISQAPQLMDKDMISELQDMEMVEEELRPITPTLHGLYYVCLMIPRLPKHHLTGDLANSLAEMIGQLCLAYGWRLEHISVRPEYLQWITSVPPVTSPSYLMRVLRQQTSERIFDAFPSLRKENPSGDFWAPGYLIMSGAQLPPAHVIHEFIQQTRHHQGVDSLNRLKA